ncbi:TerB family tellurite resistance protein [Brumimicrobium aurantiacum]|uniref:Molecular chaperone DjlA n=1 Tax=Brumimicrobium aurantiacum TaxID=1737063 RepID=A0A3E1EWD0_9FLAO|nr:TerB family tellurite resistance protein [Brumimicrobium aurantiacum]RFC53866.1 molecular chaperone DjlA [Brumimicrobium aurantiacum]
MTGYFKWIGAGLAFYLTDFSLFAAFFGFLIGSFIDNFSRAAEFVNEAQGGQGRQQNFRSSQDIFDFYQRQTQRYDFPTMLLALSAAVMKADGKAMKSELEYVKAFLQQQFGNQFTKNHLKTLKTFLDQPQDIPLQEICNDVRTRTRPEVRVQLLHYMFGIAKADGSVSPEEMQILQRIATMMGVPNMDFTSVQNMFHRDTESDYKVLGTTKDATDAEVKKAYRKMAVRYHPDKVAQMGEEYQKGAKEKFQRIQEAYENIKKERGMA